GRTLPKLGRRPPREQGGPPRRFRSRRRLPRTEGPLHRRRSRHRQLRPEHPQLRGGRRPGQATRLGEGAHRAPTNQELAHFL
ncbi:MAG: hypothetical protein AVDCRST_MAG55-1017, partial [uncultured Rubrobacteraceae bacterium]